MVTDSTLLNQGTKRETEHLSVEHKNKLSLDAMAKNAHKALNKHARNYLDRYGVNDNSIESFMLGIGELDGYERLLIPIFNRENTVAYVRLWGMSNDKAAEVFAKRIGEKASVPRSMVYPANAELLLVGEDQLIKSASSDVLVCRDELERIIAIQSGVKMPVVTGGENATFKDEWIEQLKNMRNIYILTDSDVEREIDTEELAQRMAKHIPTASIYMIPLSLDNGTRISLIDYFGKKLGTADELFAKYAKYHCGAKPIDVSQFKEITVDDIANVLDLTIKHDFVSKVVTFLVMLLAYTESDQQNVMFNADSSSGKTYICREVSKYFPRQDVKMYGKTTPTAFYYSKSLQEKDVETSQPFINLERRILIFTEQPDTQLQENLRALLSHDSKHIPFAITNKNNGKNAAMEGYILGYPSTFFCSANMRIDEQEQTRCLILSPENSPEKIMAGIDINIAKNSHKNDYDARIKNNEDRRRLIERILYIKNLHVDTINIDDSDYLKSRFMENKNTLLSKDQRGISHFMALVKAMALVNAPFRTMNGKIVATNKDVDEAMKLWSPLSESMVHGVSPQALDFYKQYVLGAYYAKNKDVIGEAKGVTYDEIIMEYFKKNNNHLNTDNLRKQYIPALKTAALISCSKDENDKRQKIVTPLVFFEGDDMDKQEEE